MKSKTVIIRKRLPRKVSSKNLTHAAYWRGMADGAKEVDSYHRDFCKQLDDTDADIDVWGLDNDRR